MERTAEAVWRNCLGYYVQDNISTASLQDMVSPHSRPVKAPGFKVITLQVPSKFCVRVARGPLHQVAEVIGITKELGHRRPPWCTPLSWTKAAGSLGSQAQSNIP